MPDYSLHDIYSRVQAGYKHVFVVPLIRFDFPKTDYLYLLYSSFLDSSSDTEIHSTSVFSHWKFFVAQLIGRKPILHYHWIEFQDLKSLFGMIYKIKMIWLFKLFGGKLVWTIHNLKPHDGKWLKLHIKLHRWMAQKSDAILVHSNSQIEEVSGLYQTSVDKVFCIPHPKFPSEFIEKSDAIDLVNQRFQLKLNANDKILGSFGTISSYKNFESTIETLDEINFKGKYLIIGYIKKGQQQLDLRLKRLANQYDWLIYHPTFVKENDLPAVMNSIDVCVFNFKDISTSGGVELARSYQRKIIAPRKGILNDLESVEDIHLFSTNEELKTLLTALSEE